MIRLPPQLLERVGALFLLVSLTVGISAAAFSPFIQSVGSKRALLEDLTYQLSSYQTRRASAGGTIDDALLQEVEQSLYSASDPGVVLSMLQSEHQAFARRANLRITATQARPQASGTVLTGVSLQVSSIGTIEQFETYLEQVRTHGRLLKVDNLSVQTPSEQNDGHNPALSMSWTLTGYMHNGVD